MKISISRDFRRRVAKAILSIIFFVIVYLILILLAIGLTILSVIGGVYIVLAKPMFFTLLLGAGLASLGFFVLFFLIKFVFKTHKIDTSHLTEITPIQEPKLFEFIGGIVKEVGTSHPKRVFLSNEVNASVFYDSSFWSMFLPVKKNLNIGLGLMNSLTEQEFKAILAHEFGHFSQKSMTVGSYVYNVNQVIYNLLYDNESFDDMIQNWANINGYFTFFLSIALLIIKGIKWVLIKMYNIVNLNHLALSREMEFHADQVAANIVGFEPFKSALLRLNLANVAFKRVLDFYDSNFPNRIKSQNVYKEQYFILKYLGEKSNLEFKNNLPIVEINDLNNFSRSKLVIKDQWASHPEVEERIANINDLGLNIGNYSNELANALLTNYISSQVTLTEKLFSTINESETFSFKNIEDFVNEFQKNDELNSFNKIYNGYYDFKNLEKLKSIDTEEFDTTIGFESLFNSKMTSLVKDSIALENDKITLSYITSNALPIKSFDYDGHKFLINEADELLSKIENEILLNERIISENDLNIYFFFKGCATKIGKEEEYIGKYNEIMEYNLEYERLSQLFFKLVDETSFFNSTTPFEEIYTKFSLKG